MEREAALGPGTFRSSVLTRMGKAELQQGRERLLGEVRPYLAGPGAQRSPAHAQALDPLGCVQPTRVAVMNT